MQPSTETRLIESLTAEPGAPRIGLDGLQAAARDRFLEKGLPSRRLESWKYTSLNALAKLDFDARTPKDVEGAALPDKLPSLLEADGGSHRLVFRNGRLQPRLSRLEGLPKGVLLDGLSAIGTQAPDWLATSLGHIADREPDSPLLDLNSAFFADGAILRVARGIELNRPVELVFLNDTGEQKAVTGLPRLLVMMEENSRACLIEHHASLGGGAGFSNGAVEIKLETGSFLRHLRLQETDESTHYFMNTQVKVGRDAHYEAFLLALGGAVAREDLRIRLQGAGGSCRLNGAYLLGNKQHSDITSVIEHQAPHTTCNEVVKGALDGQSRGVFQGLIRVQEQAQKIEGNQTHRALLLSRGAEVDAKPELEIYADDVKCSHGATVGELDSDALFYMRSRGIPERQARKLLIEAFLQETVALCGDTALRDGLSRRLTEKLRAMTGGEG